MSIEPDPFESRSDISGFLFGTYEQPVLDAATAQGSTPAGTTVAQESFRPTREEAAAFYDFTQQAAADGTASLEETWNHTAMRRWLARFDNEAALAEEYDRHVRSLPQFDGKPFDSLDDGEKDIARKMVEREFFSRKYLEFLEAKEKKNASNQDNQRKNNGEISDALVALFANCAKWIVNVLRKAFNAPTDMNNIFNKIGGDAAAVKEEESSSPTP